MRKDYDSFSEEQFLEDAHFIEWVRNPTPELRKFWEGWVASGPANLKEMQRAAQTLRAIFSATPLRVEEGSDARTWARIDHTLAARGRLVMFSGKRILRVAAASVILVIGLGIGYLFMEDGATGDAAVQVVHSDDMAPGSDKAILTLADGSSVALDSSNTDMLTGQGDGVVLRLSEGRVVYEPAGNGSGAGEVQYNTITTPRGGRYQVVLSDHTIVWLNAGSSLRYPTTFAGTERMVELTGEAYFEVAADQSRVFHVHANNTHIRVLGTRFNVNAYTDEENVKTTLLEGAVEVAGRQSKVRLLPGEQAVTGSGKSDHVDVFKTDPESAIAWKNGYFQFESFTIQEIMRQISRWYDVEVVYEGSPPEGHYVGKPSRNMNLSEIVKVIRYSGIHITLNNKTLTVKNK